jgi:hypothetical protein
MNFPFSKCTKIKDFKWFVLFLPSTKTIACQIYFYCWNEIAYLFVKKSVILSIGSIKWNFDALALLVYLFRLCFIINHYIGLAKRNLISQ